MGNTMEIIITCVALSFWVLFPIGIFIAVGRLDKDTDQVVRLEHLRERALREAPDRYRVEHFDWHHPVLYFKRWLQHD